jgi:hypothetical protein
MQFSENPTPVASKRISWNKGKLTGAKPPLRPKHVWSIRSKLQMADRKRDLALFNLAIDSKLRGCDVVAVKVEDIAPHGYALDRATVRQKKLAGRCGSSWPNKPGKRLMTTLARRTASVISEPKIRISSRLSTPRYGRICLWRKPDIEQPLNDYA